MRFERSVKLLQDCCLTPRPSFFTLLLHRLNPHDLHTLMQYLHRVLVIQTSLIHIRTDGGSLRVNNACYYPSLALLHGLACTLHPPLRIPSLPLDVMFRSFFFIHYLLRTSPPLITSSSFCFKPLLLPDLAPKILPFSEYPH